MVAMPEREEQAGGVPPVPAGGARIERLSEPTLIRRLGDGGGVYQVALNAGPDRLWRSLFADQADYDLDFVPALVHFTYHPPAANFQAEEWQLKRRLELLDAWLERTNQSRGASPPRPKGQPRRGKASKEEAAPEPEQ